MRKHSQNMVVVSYCLRLPHAVITWMETHYQFIETSLFPCGYGLSSSYRLEQSTKQSCLSQGLT